MNTQEQHREYEAMLMEYLDGDLSAEKSAEFVVHLLQCETCAAEVRMARMLQQHLGTQRELPNEFSDERHVQKSFERVWQRIEAKEAQGKARLARQKKWLPFAIAATVLVLSGVAGWYERARQPEYRTLAQSLPRAECGELHVRFADNFSAADITQLMSALSTQIVAGPTAHGVYTLRAAQPAAALARLRLHPAVALVEPVSC